MSCIVEGKTHAEVARGIKVFVGPLVPQNENDGSDNLDGESHEVGPTDDLQYREGDADEDEEAGFDLIVYGHAVVQEVREKPGAWLAG